MNMQRFAPYLGIVAGLIFGAFVISLFSRATVSPTPAAVSNTPSTISVVNSAPVSTSIATTSTQTASAPKKITLPKAPPPLKATEGTARPVIAAIPVLPSVAEINAALDVSASALRAALVNIICYAPAGGAIHSISGSGVIIDSKGIILTDAHIAQYLLLADRSVSCTIRSGSPAADRYEARLIYISPAWLRANPKVLTETLPSGNGEYDFAFLAISKSATTNSLPDSFPFVPLAILPPTTGTPVVIASYAAQFLESSQVQSSLFPTVVFGSVKDIFTFATNTIDVLALGGSAAAQEGSSGGGVASASGDLVGVITTSTVTGTTDTRSLDAITAFYIRGEYASETGQPLDFLLSKPTSASITDFASQISTLEAIITANLP